MKIRIFALAKELDIDSKVLIQHCNDAGIPVKASALASISPDERDILLKYLESMKSGEQGQEEPSATAAPSREELTDIRGTTKSLKTMVPRTKPPITRRPKEEPPTADSDSETEDETTGLEDDEIGTDQELEVAAEATGDVGDDLADDGNEPSTPAQEKQGSPKIEPITREDYVSGTGSSQSSIREMRPRGTTISAPSPGESRRPKGRAKPALPNVAAPPSYKPPKLAGEAKEEERAQKPDLKLTPEILEQQSPLGARMRKHAEQKKKQVIDEGMGDESGAGSRERGSLGLVEARQQRRQKRQQAKQLTEEESPGRRSVRFQQRKRRQRSGQPIEFKTEAEIELPTTLRAFSEALGRPAKQLMQILFQQGKMVTINETIDEETALMLAMELEVELHIKRERDIEEELLADLDEEEAEETLELRPPIVTILGHVDHGKTSLLDKIRSANVAGGEAGGITQHIAAYQVDHNGQKVTFVDTPGHAAFGEMRARGANVTDIVVLVVAADDGVMPQTEECIAHAKASGVPMMVALNKIDLPDANDQKALQGLAGRDVLAAEWGGDIEVVRTSATTGQGIDELLETILTIAELHEFKANPARPASGVCLEAFMDEGRGAIAWLIVQRGTLRVGDIVVCGSAHGRIRAIYNDQDEEIDEAPPSMPVKVTGLDEVPGAGDHFFAMTDLDDAREVAETRRQRGRTQVLSGRGRPRSLDDILQAARGGSVQDLPLIIKADTPGSIEALRSEIDKFDHPEVRVNILHAAVGGVNESDVSLASASGAIIVAFHVIAEDRAEILADQEGVEIRRYNIIYEVTDEIKRSLEGLLEPERKEIATGRALVLQTFHISRFGTIAGCRVLNGTIDRSNRVNVIRDQTILNSYNIASLRREKDDAKEVREGMECGIRLEGFNDVKEGDLLEAYRVEFVKRKLESAVRSSSEG